jgi:hypothetical protein
MGSANSKKDPTGVLAHEMAFFLVNALKWRVSCSPRVAGFAKDGLPS